MRDDQIEELESLTKTMTDDLIKIAYAVSESVSSNWRKWKYLTRSLDA